MLKKCIDQITFKECRDYNLGLWQCPGFLFLIMGVVNISSMLGVYIIVKAYDMPEFVVLSVSMVSILIFAVGASIIRGMEQIAVANKMKSEFVAIVSHQLKNPLSGVSWDIELLIAKHKSGLNQRQLDIIKKINYSNKIMTRLVNDLLDVARIDQGNLFVRKDKFNIENIIKKVVIKNEPLIKQSGIRINIEAPDVMPMIIGDEKRLEVALDNLVSNAIKYNNKDGTVFIKIEKREKVLIICIKDTGIGIPEKEQDQIFDRFYRSTKAIRKETGGTGLGLYIAKNIIEQCGGKIWFESEEDKGSIFCFTVILA